MNKSLAKVAFYGVAIILLLWTGSLTVSFVSGVLPNEHWLVPYFALVVFDVGMLAWLKVFIDLAAGTGQRATALILTLFDLLGVGLMAMAEIFLGGQTLALAPARLGEYALWGVGLWTVGNVAAVVAFHLLDPGARQKMALQVEMDAIFGEALKKLSDKRAQQSGQLSDQLANGMMRQLVAELAASNDHNSLPTIAQPGGVGLAEHKAINAPLAANVNGQEGQN
jgi:hypothetical protein